MTEKRFSLCEFETDKSDINEFKFYEISDNTKQDYDDDCAFYLYSKKGYGINDLVDLLNKQEQRIEALESGFEKDLKAMDNDCMKCEKRYQELIKELEKENKTLKDTINGLTDTLAHTIDITPCGDVE